MSKYSLMDMCVSVYRSSHLENPNSSTDSPEKQCPALLRIPSDSTRGAAAAIVHVKPAPYKPDIKSNIDLHTERHPTFIGTFPVHEDGLNDIAEESIPVIARKLQIKHSIGGVKTAEQINALSMELRGKLTRMRDHGTELAGQVVHTGTELVMAGIDNGIELAVGDGLNRFNILLVCFLWVFGFGGVELGLYG
ncbi:hypothetical protein BDW66DRAFT_152764 [Aspergillus desertorum]